MLCLLLLVTALGRRVADLLPVTLKESAGFYIAPLLGLAGLVLVTTVYGWWSPFKTTLSIAVSVGLFALCIFFEKQKRDLFLHWLVISAFAIVATIPIFAPLIRFDSYNPFNDTFTYLVHGQWLQSHAFSEAARASGFFPAETQVVLYQRAGHRMGGSFFLAFVQSLFQLEWSYYAYVPTVASVFALGSLAIGGVIRQVIAIPRAACLALCTLPAFAMNGFVYGAQHGFFPQTFGIAFCAGLACLIPGVAASTLSAKPSWKRQFLNLLPLAICFSALLISYNDMFPIVGAGIGLYLIAVCALYWSERYRVMGSVLMLTVQVMALVNVESVRILKNFIDTLLGAATGAVHFGWPVLWSPIQFVAHSFGMKSPFESNVFLADRIISTWIIPIVLIGVALVLAKILRQKPRNLAVIFLICINVVLWLVFAKFRYATPGLDGQVGNTFLQFKLAKWAAPFNLGLLAIAIAWLYVHLERYRAVCTYVFLGAFTAGMTFHYVVVSQIFTRQFQDETMRRHSGFNQLLELRSRVADIPKDQVIYLGIGTEHHKLTQLVAYVLPDRKLAGSYDDTYLVGSLPASERNMSVEIADWMIQHQPAQALNENPLERVGPFLIRRAPFSFFRLESVTGAYATETSDKRTWNWVKDSVDYRFRSVGETNRVRIKFQFTGSPGTLFLEVSTYSGKRVASFEVPMNGGWGQYESPTVDSGSEDLVIRFKANGDPVRLSGSDPREVQFLIQNLSLQTQAPTNRRLKKIDLFRNENRDDLSVEGLSSLEINGKERWRWGLGPETRIHFHVDPEWPDQARHLLLNLAFTNAIGISGQMVTIRLNGTDIRRFSSEEIANRERIDAAVALVARKGANILQIVYKDWNHGEKIYAPHDPRPLAVGVKRLVLQGANE